MNGMPVEDRDKELVQKFRSVVNRKEQQKKSRIAVRLSVFVMSGLAVAFVFLASGRLKHQPNRPGAIPSSPPVAAGPETPSASSSPEKNGSTRLEKAGAKSTIPLKKRRYPARTASTASSVKKSDDIRITEIVTCKRVNGRRYISPQTVYSLKKDANPDVWVWMELDAERKAIPCTLRHVYYLEGRKYTEVPLAIRHSSTRTWSNLSLNRPIHVGRWRVAVMTQKGETLSQIEFTVTP